ncbi:MAG TPA: tetratricopeptide repeat protein [Steroidobacteraceae bacterium]|nr:tetratricopeptide repeat protein [Steroidobacteraceae bacterium]HQR49837.1 tetratricopeptide repeat protein [Steroidobacteraceae bacterium]
MNTFWMVFTGTLATGWGATAAYAEYRRRRRARRRARYLEGVRYLLDDKPERALEVFLGLAANDDETIDTHFALGSLYRRRGEVERAIRVHQHIVERTGLDPRHRDAALTELARDYFRAGLYDRAEKLFLELADSGREPAVALAHLVRIHELQHDWEQAAAMHERLRAVGIPDQPSAIAHYWCELAEAAIARRDLDEARAHLRTARAEHKDSGRVSILRGDVARMQGDPALAVQLYRKVVRRDFHLLPLVLPRLADAARLAGDAGVFDESLRELLRNGIGNRSEIAYAAIVSGYYDDPVILECVRELLSTDSDLRDLTSALLPPGTEPTMAQLRAVSGALRNVVQRHARYRCSVCGIDSSTFLWQCPGCKSWDTQRAIAALEFLPRAARPGAPAD